MITAKEMLARPATQREILTMNIPKGAVTVLASESDAGKSLCVLQLALCVASGREFLGQPVDAAFRRVLFVSTEDDEMSIEWRLRTINQTMGLDPDELARIRFHFDSENLIEHLQGALDSEPADLVVIDALGDLLTGVDGNSASGVRSVMSHLQLLAAVYGCAVVCVHHVVKGASERTVHKDLLLGSGAIQAKSRLVMYLKKEIASGRRLLYVVKGNYLSDDLKRHALVLHLDDSLLFTTHNERVDLFASLEEDSGGNDYRAELNKMIADSDQLLSRFFPTGREQYPKKQLLAMVMQNAGYRKVDTERLLFALEEKGVICNCSTHPFKTIYAITNSN